jgi:hypothetical protein
VLSFTELQAGMKTLLGRMLERRPLTLSRAVQTPSSTLTSLAAQPKRKERAGATDFRQHHIVGPSADDILLLGGIIKTKMLMLPN